MNKPYPCAQITPVPSQGAQAPEAPAQLEQLHAAVREAVADFPHEIREALEVLMAHADDPATLSDLISQQFLRDPDERQMLLELEDVGKRVAYLEGFLKRGVL